MSDTKILRRKTTYNIIIDGPQAHLIRKCLEAAENGTQPTLSAAEKEELRFLTEEFDPDAENGIKPGDVVNGLTL